MRPEPTHGGTELGILHKTSIPRSNSDEVRSVGDSLVMIGLAVPAKRVPLITSFLVRPAMFCSEVSVPGGDGESVEGVHGPMGVVRENR